MSEELENTPGSPAADDPKAKFREALERKKQGGGAGPGVGATQGGSGATHGKVGGKREFRRKSS
ncbi:MAG TPA: DUF5302 domain-containing protein [Microbacteriaceae bacterium]|nr:DUF5302 domain-containing protein [Microbacteriaceae bacterium]